LEQVLGGAALTAAEPLLHLGAEGRQGGLAAVLLPFEEPQGITHHLAGTGVASAAYLVLDEPLEVGAHCVAGWHGCNHVFAKLIKI